MTIILEGISVFQIKSFLTADTRLFYEGFFTKHATYIVFVVLPFPSIAF